MRGGGDVHDGAYYVIGTGALPSPFGVTALAAATIGAAGAELATFMADDGAAALQPTVVDRRLASLWFGLSIRPDGWALPPVWDSIAGDYQAKDGWIKLHTNAPHHRSAALKVLGGLDDRNAVQSAIAGWMAQDLERAIVDAGGCAAQMRSLSAWRDHPQGAAVTKEPLIAWRNVGNGPPTEDHASESNLHSAPLRGVRILDLTRVLAGPVATRFLAAFGANVLRIDPPDWDEGVVIPEVTAGKRCAGLDLKTADGRAAMEKLIKGADVIVHGYRPNALAALGFDHDRFRQLNPKLIDVSLCAYGWTGPWSTRRGFDSLVQMSCGIAHEGMVRAGTNKPTPLPVQALDQATGYLMAAAVLRALRIRNLTGRVMSARTSLARTAALLVESLGQAVDETMPPETEHDWASEVEATGWGPARRIKFPVSIGDITGAFVLPAGPLRRAQATW